MQIRAARCIYWNISNVQWDWNIALHIWPWISDDVVRCFLITGVRDWIEKTNTPSGLGAQPPVTPLQNHSISSAHYQKVTRTVVHTLSESGENRSYLELRLRRPCSSITSQTPDTLSHLAETLAITGFCRINRQQPSQNPNLSLRQSALNLKFYRSDLQ